MLLTAPRVSTAGPSSQACRHQLRSSPRRRNAFVSQALISFEVARPFAQLELGSSDGPSTSGGRGTASMAVTSSIQAAASAAGALHCPWPRFGIVAQTINSSKVTRERLNFRSALCPWLHPCLIDICKASKLSLHCNDCRHPARLRRSSQRLSRIWAVGSRTWRPPRNRIEASASSGATRGCGSEVLRRGLLLTALHM